jgi:hypothetical protein
MQTLLDCRSCSGFVPPGVAACPCCGAAVAQKASPAVTSLRAALGLAASGLMAVTLMACYGLPNLPSCSDSDKVDADGDGFFVPKPEASCDVDAFDCDDNDPSRHPGAPDSVGDGIDQNCDGEDGDVGAGGSAGSAGSAGTAGTAGAAGTAGTGGSGGSGTMGSGGSGM